MRIYNDIRQCYSELKRNVAELGSEVKLKTYQNLNIEGNSDYDTRELLGETFKLLENIDSNKVLEYIKEVKGEKWAQWCIKDFEERVSKSLINPGDCYNLVDNYWSKFLDKSNKQDYTYNERIGRKLQGVQNELIRDISSRRAYLNIWETEDVYSSSKEKRVPCSLGYIFLVRDNKLHLTYMLRSSDVMELLLIDIYMAQRMKELMVEKLNENGKNIKLGTLTIFINSLHAYNKDIKEVF